MTVFGNQLAKFSNFNNCLCKLGLVGTRTPVFHKIIERQSLIMVKKENKNSKSDNIVQF